MVLWDIDRYEQLQDAAWALELLANEQRVLDDTRTGVRPAAMSRTRARALRQQAADLLAQYWVPRSPITR